MLPILGNDLLRGDLVTLVKPTRDDIEQFASWTNDVEYSRLLRRGMVYPNSAELMQGWFAEMEKQEDDFPFSIRTLTDNRLVGVLVIKDVFWSSRHSSFWIGIGKAADRGQGYGSDAVKVMLKYCFLEMNMHAVRLEVMGYNTAGIRSYEKVGFKSDGVMRAFVYRDGIYYDVHLMSILRREWAAQYGFTGLGE